MGRAPAKDWDAICAAATERFPVIDTPQFFAHMERPDLLATVLRDVLGVENMLLTGTREVPDVATGLARLNKMLDNGYSMDPFPLAMRICTRDQSVRVVARKVTAKLADGMVLSKSRAARLLAGTATPSPAELEAIARAYDRDPVWFADYRIHVIVTLVTEAVRNNPERTAVLVKKLLR